MLKQRKTLALPKDQLEELFLHPLLVDLLEELRVDFAFLRSLQLAGFPVWGFLLSMCWLV